MIVDLPDPDGPQITMRSPRRTSRLMPFSTWKSPNHLLTSAIVMMTSPSLCDPVSVVVEAMISKLP